MRESQTVFGERFGVSRQAVYNWEQGVYEPGADVMMWITAAAISLSNSNSNSNSNNHNKGRQ